MHSLIAQLTAGIEKGDDEAFLAASEVAAAIHFGIDRYQAMEPYGECLRAEPLDQEDVEALKNALIHHLTSSPRAAAGAAFALGKFHDPAIAPVLREQLARHLKALLAYNGALSNLICALENSGEKVIGDGVHSLMQTEKMIADARAYLEKHGQQFPW